METPTEEHCVLWINKRAENWVDSAMAFQFRAALAVDKISHFMEARGDSFALNKLKRWGRDTNRLRF